MSTVEQIKAAYEAFIEENAKFVEKGNKAAGGRARKALMELAKLAARYSDGIIMGDGGVAPELKEYCGKLGLPVLPYNKEEIEGGSYLDTYNAFYDNLLQ